MKTGSDVKDLFTFFGYESKIMTSTENHLKDLSLSPDCPFTMRQLQSALANGLRVLRFEQRSSKDPSLAHHAKNQEAGLVEYVRILGADGVTPFAELTRSLRAHPRASKQLIYALVSVCGELGIVLDSPAKPSRGR
jgi:hypothetical protein